MKRLKKKAVKETNITNLLVVDDTDISVSDDVFLFFEDNLLDTVRSVANDDKNGTLVIHCVMDRALFEQHVGYPVDDATCKVVTKAFTHAEFMTAIIDKLEDLAKELGHSGAVVKVDFDFGDGVFHVIAILSKG